MCTYIASLKYVNLYLKNLDKYSFDKLFNDNKLNNYNYIDDFTLKHSKSIKFYLLNNVFEEEYVRLIQRVIDYKIIIGKDIDLETIKKIMIKISDGYKYRVDFLEKNKKNNPIPIKIYNITLNFYKNYNKNQIPKNSFKNIKDYKNYLELNKQLNVSTKEYYNYLLKYKKNIKNNNLYYLDSNKSYNQSFQIYNPNVKNSYLKYVKESFINILILHKIITLYKNKKQFSFIEYYNDFERIKKEIKKDKIYQKIKNLNKDTLVQLINIIIKQLKDSSDIIKKTFKNNGTLEKTNIVSINKQYRDKIIKKINSNNFYFNIPNKKMYTDINIKPVPKMIEKIRSAAYEEAPVIKNNKIIKIATYRVNLLLHKSFFNTDYKSLFLHEAIPGHCYHSTYVLDLYKQKKLKNNEYFNTWNSFYYEGYALFVENCLFDLNPEYKDIVGKINYELFRHMRVIIDIGLNYFQVLNEDICVKMLSNLCFIHKNEIQFELIRYVQMKAQAVSYAIGKNYIHDTIKTHKENTLIYFIENMLKNK